MHREEVHRKVVQGTCGWSDPSLYTCKRFYPLITNNTSKDKLHFYSRRGGLGCVEVDSSTYSIMRKDAVKSWIDATPKDFIFHVKAFGALCNNGIDAKFLPNEIRGESKGWTTLDDLGSVNKNLLWHLFNESLSPFIISQKLGVVIFQFQTNFDSTDIHRKYVEECADSLRPESHMAIEFRCRTWFNESNREATLVWLRSLRNQGIGLIASDDLECEIYKDSPSRKVLPLHLTSHGCPAYAFIRVHRREGNQRVLTPTDFNHWKLRIEKLLMERDLYNPDKLSLNGPIYILWGTDYDDQPIINIQTMADTLNTNGLVFDWASSVCGKKSSLRDLWGSIETGSNSKKFRAELK
jgi:uncharacterized protein YecE (DUF72 family)